MRSFLALLLAFLLLVPCAALGEEEELAMEEVAVEDSLLSVPLPIDFSGGFAPREDGYQGETVYEDPTIRVEITYKDVRTEYDPSYTASVPKSLSQKDIGVFIVDIRIGDASQLRTIANKSFTKNSADNVLAIAARVNPVVATNGDFVTRRSEGLIIRQGVNYKDKL